jgi:hypothetical protein
MARFALPEDSSASQAKATSTLDWARFQAGLEAKATRLGNACASISFGRLVVAETWGRLLGAVGQASCLPVQAASSRGAFRRVRRELDLRRSSPHELRAGCPRNRQAGSLP